jgi:hypothetical protein
MAGVRCDRYRGHRPGVRGHGSDRHRALTAGVLGRALGPPDGPRSRRDLLKLTRSRRRAAAETGASAGDRGESAIDYEGREVVHGFAPNGIILICFLLTQ